ncbi:MFS transporter [uncultured Pseudoteredinibacter sp.]|uniref:MFS transporter n=1 Tax=uncultured Pseudoteredinibacter sp. TaxID=1641701 RepID=UPI002621B092|nr:MFS transporter [uncultured Pseudoteredinibacter sp.]
MSNTTAQINTQGTGWRSPYALLAIMTVAMPLAFSTWYALLNNFVVERAQFNGADIGLLQSVREIPGFLAFTVVFILLFLREQRFAILSLFTLGLGVSLTGLLPSSVGLLCTTFIMSVGFHYFETLKKSLTLQWLPKDQAPALMGKLLGIGSASSMVVYAFIIWQPFGYETTYMLGGGLCMLLALFMFLAYPLFPEKEPQHKKLFLRKRYWLYYALVFMSGARRQIFMVFAGFMMVEKFHYDVSDIATLYLINHAINSVIAAPIGRWINRVGERTALSLEYIGLILVFVSYAFVNDAKLAAGLYIIDHLFFSMAIAINSYFQKIADPKDIAATSGVSFTINHIAAVVIPVSFGLLWMTSSAAVFLLGAAMALVSLILARKIPCDPSAGNEVR